MLELIKINSKLIFNKGYFIGWFFLVILSIFIDFNMYTQLEMYQLSERFFSLVGIIWIGSVLIPESKKAIRASIYQTRFNHIKTLVIRLLLMLTSLLCAFTLVLFVAKIKGANLDLLITLMTCLVNGIYLGMITLLVTVLFDHVILGYLFSFAYYYFELTTGGQYTGKISLMSASKGFMIDKFYLLGLTILIIIMIFFLFNKKTRYVSF